MVCKINDDYSYSYRKCLHEKDSKFKHFLLNATVLNSGPMTISISQKDKRCYSHKEVENIKYCLCTLKLYKVSGVSRQLIQEKRDYPHRDFHMEIKDGLTYGNYLVLAEIDWERDNQTPREFVVSFYG